MAINSGRQVVAEAGEAVALAGSTAIVSVTITALSTNTKLVVLGGKDVVAAAGTRKGTPLAAGESIKFGEELDAIDDLSSIWLDAEVNGEGVSYSYGHRP
ncbi:MAG: hypothetical protein ACRDK4_04975 [Solirubrobacteraceae bacterium]